MINNNYSQQITFSGRNKILRDADWVCRKVNSEFPSIMPNRLFYENPDMILKNPRIGEFLHKKNQQLTQNRKVISKLFEPFERFKALIETTKKYKVAQCSELSALAELVARINGVKYCQKFSIKDYDHAVLLVSDKPIKPTRIGENDIIIDPWLGISGSVGDVFRKYKHQYSKLFPIGKNEVVSLIPAKPMELSRSQIEHFKDYFPKLIFKSADGHELMKKNSRI